MRKETQDQLVSKLPEITLIFWIMKICATTLGETAGDLLTKTHEKGGLGFGTVGSSLVLFSILFLLILYTVRNETRKPLQSPL